MRRKYDQRQCRFDMEGLDEVEGGDFDKLRAEYLAAKTATERKRCEFLEIRIQTAKGELISAEEVEKAMFAKGRVIRDGIFNIPDRVAPLLINKSNLG
ncbi:MAG: hypothetical protein LBJ96_04570, partial [Holosporaceae bacterium]|nr:hypothetical protein [Holosporaceae bacterium]